MGIPVAEDGYITKAELNAARGREGMEKAYAQGNMPREEYIAATAGFNEPVRRKFKPKEPAQQQQPSKKKKKKTYQEQVMNTGQMLDDMSVGQVPRDNVETMMFFDAEPPA